MGHRTVKRVPLDFDWPKGKVWKGYINPHFKKCPENGKTCFHGENAAACYLSHITSMLCVAASSAFRGDTHPYLYSLPYKPEHPDWSIQPKEIRERMVDFVSKLCDEQGKLGPLAFTGSGHHVFFKLLDAAGIKNTHEDNSPAYKWCYCLVCNGSGIDPAVKAEYDAWKESEPPVGPGWQLWETVSEGSPISPVFETAEALAEWCEKGATIFASEKMPREKWLELFKEKDALEVGSMMVMHNGYMGSVAQAPKEKTNEA